MFVCLFVYQKFIIATEQPRGATTIARYTNQTFVSYLFLFASPALLLI